MPHVAVYAHGIAIAVAFGLITCLHVILGELFQDLGPAAG